MNDTLKSTIDACLALANTKREFIDNIKKTTGLTDKGISKISYIQEKYDKAI